MNTALVDKVVKAVLYEGYILYPYRASSKKNRERFTFGRVYPQDYSSAQNGAEPCLMQTECLVRNESKDALVAISVRFLHPMAREVGILSALSTKCRRLDRRILRSFPTFESVSNFIRPGRRRWSRRWNCLPSLCAKHGRPRTSSRFPPRARWSRFAATTEKFAHSSCADRRRPRSTRRCLSARRRTL
jgi:hypothetical protein